MATGPTGAPDALGAQAQAMQVQNQFLGTQGPALFYQTMDKNLNAMNQAQGAGGFNRLMQAGNPTAIGGGGPAVAPMMQPSTPMGQIASGQINPNPFYGA